ncbi:MAG: hypothetical protein ACRC9X_05805 [Bacteroidales bacterium]
MPIDFFASQCANATTCNNATTPCMQRISPQKFGISDNDSNNHQPAKVVFNNPDSWDFTVENNTSKSICFKAIDFCINIFRTGTYDLKNDDRDPNAFSSGDNGIQPIKRCEGLLKIDDQEIIFLEIKRRQFGNWLKDAREKFEETILSFREHHPQYCDKPIKAIVSNPLCPYLHQSSVTQQKILKDKIGVPLELKSTMII